jgi:hypothetical protein
MLERPPLASCRRMGWVGPLWTAREDELIKRIDPPEVREYRPPRPAPISSAEKALLAAFTIPKVVRGWYAGWCPGASLLGRHAFNRR